MSIVEKFYKNISQRKHEFSKHGLQPLMVAAKSALAMRAFHSCIYRPEIQRQCRVMSTRRRHATVYVGVTTCAPQGISRLHVHEIQQTRHVRISTRWDLQVICRVYRRKGTWSAMEAARARHNFGQIGTVLGLSNITVGKLMQWSSTNS